MLLLPGRACRFEALGEAWSPRHFFCLRIVCVCLRFNYFIFSLGFLKNKINSSVEAVSKPYIG